MTTLPLYRKPHRVRTYLALFALALILPLLSVAVFALNRMAETERSEIERRVLQVASNLAVIIDQELDRALVTLETLATSSELRSGDLRGFHQQAILALKPKKAAIVLIDRSYRQLVDTLKEFGAELPPTADPATAQLVFESGQAQISNLFRGSVNGLPVFNVEVPVFDSSRQVQNVLIMSFQAAHLSDLLEQVQLSPSWIAGITDTRGIILARSREANEYVGKPLPAELFAQTKAAGGFYRAVNVAGESILRATARSERAGWYVSATVPLSHVEEPHIRGYSFAVLLLALATSLGLALAYIFGQLMARPLDQATRVAASVGRGDKIETSTTSLFEANLLIHTLEKASGELQARADHATYLMRELAHRAKNQLAVVKGMALQTARQSPNIAEFSAQFDRRIQGLAQSQEVLLQQDWRGAWLQELVRAHLDLFGAHGGVQIEGPDIFLDATAVQNVGFALHELATNASKHGALSVSEGRVSIGWTAPGQGSVHLTWVEEGGTKPLGPMRQGFGHRVITELVPRALQGSSRLEFTADGLRWQLEIPDHHVLRNQRRTLPPEHRAQIGDYA
jgi:two-component sensor histidine kinase